jgi:hypothetical protein
MTNLLELAVGTIVMAWLAMIAVMAFFYLTIDHQQREITRIKEKIDFCEKSIKRISEFFVAIKSEPSVL